MSTVSPVAVCHWFTKSPGFAASEFPVLWSSPRGASLRPGCWSGRFSPYGSVQAMSMDTESQGATALASCPQPLLLDRPELQAGFLAVATALSAQDLGPLCYHLHTALASSHQLSRAWLVSSPFLPLHGPA